MGNVTLHQLGEAKKQGSSYEDAVSRLAETTQARDLLAGSDITIGGEHEVREQVDLAALALRLPAPAGLLIFKPQPIETPDK